MKILRLKNILFICVFALIFISCSDNGVNTPVTQNNIIGTWKNVSMYSTVNNIDTPKQDFKESDLQIVFNSDNTATGTIMTLTMINAIIFGNMTYKIENNKLIILFNSRTYTFDASISGKQMTLKYHNKAEGIDYITTTILEKI